MEAVTLTQAARAAHEDNDAHYQAVLRTLIDQGAALAARIAASATAATTPDSALPEATIAFDRAARAVRRTIALARHIAANPAPAAAASPDARIKARTRLIRTVEDAIHVQHRVYEGDREALDAEFAERLEDPALEFDLQGRDIDDVIQEICQDLGIVHPTRSYIYRRRTPQDVVHLRTRAATPSAEPIQPGHPATQPATPHPGTPPLGKLDAGRAVPYATANIPSPMGTPHGRPSIRMTGPP